MIDKKKVKKIGLAGILLLVLAAGFSEHKEERRIVKLWSYRYKV